MIIIYYLCIQLDEYAPGTPSKFVVTPKITSNCDILPCVCHMVMFFYPLTIIGILL